MNHDNVYESFYHYYYIFKFNIIYVIYCGNFLSILDEKIIQTFNFFFIFT